MDFSRVTKILNQFSNESLIGEEAHFEIAPYRVRHSYKKDDTARIAAVLILLYPIENNTHFALIQRPDYDGSHSGQISFPGGKWEKEDDTIIQTALREAWEETNIEANNLKVIGELSQIFIPPSNFEVTPVLAVSNYRPSFKADNREVEEILEINLSELLHPENLLEKEISLGKGKSLTTPYFNLQARTVWGATAMILNELKHYLIQEDKRLF